MLYVKYCMCFILPYDDFEIMVENLQSQLLVLFCSYFELQDVFILWILFLFVLAHLNLNKSNTLV